MFPALLRGSPSAEQARELETRQPSGGSLQESQGPRCCRLGLSSVGRAGGWEQSRGGGELLSRIEELQQGFAWCWNRSGARGRTGNVGLRMAREQHGQHLPSRPLLPSVLPVPSLKRLPCSPSSDPPVSAHSDDTAQAAQC